MKQIQTRAVPSWVLMEHAGGAPSSPVILLALLAMVCAGCGTPLIPETVVPPTRVDVTIPPLPGVYQDWTVRWNITWWDGNRVRRQSKSADADATVSVSIKPASNGSEVVVVSAVPRITAVDVELRPYGGWIYPPAQRCTLSLEAGALALTLIRVSGDGLDPALVNIPRIQIGIVEELSNGARRIDRHRLEEGLRGLAFRRYHIRPLTESPLEVRFLSTDLPASADWDELDEEGWTWISDDPADPYVDAITAGAYLVLAPEVAPGHTRSLWRSQPVASDSPQSAHPTFRKMTVHRSADGHGSYHIFPVVADGGVPD